MLAESGNKFLVYLSGTHPGGQRFSDLMFVMGGMGARADRDGLSCMSFPANSSNLPTEVLESTCRSASAGGRCARIPAAPATWRGGLGQVVEMESLFRCADHRPRRARQARHRRRSA